MRRVVFDKTYFVPEYLDHQKMATYFAEFISENKKIDEKRTFAFWGKQLDWPTSLLNEVVHGQCVLAPSRIVEFALHFRLDVADIEFLNCLSLLDSKDSVVRSRTQMLIDSYFQPATFHKNEGLELKEWPEWCLYLSLRFNAGKWDGDLFKRFLSFGNQGASADPALLLQTMVARGIFKEHGNGEFVTLKRASYIGPTPHQSYLVPSKSEALGLRRIVHLTSSEARHLKRQIQAYINMVRFLNNHVDPRPNERLRAYFLEMSFLPLKEANVSQNKRVPRAPGQNQDLGI